MYLEDDLIYSNNLEDHIKHVDQFLTTLKEAGNTLKIKKWYLFQWDLEYLGHNVNLGQLEMEKTNVESLRNAKPSTNNTHLR